MLDRASIPPAFLLMLVGCTAVRVEKRTSIIAAASGGSSAGPLSAGRLADVIDERFLGRLTIAGPPFSSADRNPARPHLALKATITSENRVSLERDVGGPGCRQL